MPTRTERVPLLSPAPGTERSLLVHRYGEPGARPRAYLHAALHADEWPGLLVLQHLMGFLDEALARGEVIGEVVVVPFANPVGLAQAVNQHLLGRYDLAAGGNFNRDFPDLAATVVERIDGRVGRDPHENVACVRALLAEAAAALPRGTESEMLKAVLLELSTPSDLVFDLHCDSEALAHVYALERQRGLATELADELGAPVVLLEEDPGGNAFDQANSSPWRTLAERSGPGDPIPMACFATTVELRGVADVRDDYAGTDARALYRFMQRRGVIAGDPGPLPAPRCQVSPLEGMDVVAAPAAGIVVYRKQLGDVVAVDEVVAELVTLTGNDPRAGRAEIRSRARGVLFSCMAERFVRPGQSICKIAGAEKLDHRIDGNLLGD